jgi:hypothetical protein
VSSARRRAWRAQSAAARISSTKLSSRHAAHQRTRHQLQPAGAGQRDADRIALHVAQLQGFIANLAHGAAAEIGAHQRQRLLRPLRIVQRQRGGQLAQLGADQYAQMTHHIALIDG